MSDAQDVTETYVLVAFIAPDEVGHSWPALGMKSGSLSNLGKEKEIHDNEVIRVLSIGG